MLEVRGRRRDIIGMENEYALAESVGEVAGCFEFEVPEVDERPDRFFPLLCLLLGELFVVPIDVLEILR